MATTNCQPDLVIAVLGHVANGKSTLVKQITGVRTQKHSSEARGETRTLGYVNVKLFGCSKCDAPRKYQFRHSAITATSCDDSRCDGTMTQLLYISFLDCPGHNDLMETVLSGTSVMHACIIVEDVSNPSIPATQTVEHIQAVDMAGIPIMFACMNKLDLVSRDQAQSAMSKLRALLQRTSAATAPMVPISASHGINFDVVAEYMYTMSRDILKASSEDPLRMICVRSFNINKQNTKVADLKGGSLGGSVVKGSVSVGDTVRIFPGLIQKSKSKKETWNYLPLHTTVKEIYTDSISIPTANPGGLVSIQTGLDPALTAKNRIIGSTIQLSDSPSEDMKVYEKVTVKMYLLNEGDVVDEGYTKLKVGDIVTLNCSAAKSKATIEHIKKKKYIMALMERPICCVSDTVIMVSRQLGRGAGRLIGMAKVDKGIESTMVDTL